MKPLLIFFALTCLVPLQTHILSLLPFSVPLDLVLIATYYYGYFHGKTRGILFGAYLGLLTDVLSGELLGTQMFLKILVGYFSAVFGFGIFIRDLPIHFLLLVFFSLAHGLLNLMLVNIFGGNIPAGEAFVLMILPAMIWNAVIGSLVIFIVQKRRIRYQSLASRENGE